MGKAKDYFDLSIGAPNWEAARGPLDVWLKRLSTRLDVIEGRSGTPTFYSDVNLNGHSILNASGTVPASTQLVTKAYVDAIISSLTGAVGPGTADTLPKFITPTTLGDSLATDDGVTFTVIADQDAIDNPHTAFKVQTGISDGFGGVRTEVFMSLLHCDDIGIGGQSFGIFRPGSPQQELDLWFSGTGGIFNGLAYTPDDYSTNISIEFDAPNQTFYFGDGSLTPGSATATIAAGAYKVGASAGIDFSGAITNLTVVKGIVTAAS